MKEKYITVSTLLLRIYLKNKIGVGVVATQKTLSHRKAVGAVQKEKFAVVEVLVRRREATTRYSVNGHFDRLNDRSH